MMGKTGNFWNRITAGEDCFEHNALAKIYLLRIVLFNQYEKFISHWTCVMCATQVNASHIS